MKVGRPLAFRIRGAEQPYTAAFADIRYAFCYRLSGCLGIVVVSVVTLTSTCEMARIPKSGSSRNNTVGSGTKTCSNPNPCGYLLLDVYLSEISSTWLY
jgi:hypothetical protein